MSDCNATIQVGGETLGCNDCFGPVDAHAHRWLSDDETTTVVWNDAASGATPHRDPEPRYEVRRFSRHFQVAASDDLMVPAVATFFGGDDGHPDPHGAAEAEAARLNGDIEWSTVSDVSRVIAAEVERDRYRRALSRIVQEEGRKGQNCDGDCSHGCRSSMKSFHLALHALEGRP